MIRENPPTKYFSWLSRLSGDCLGGHLSLWRAVLSGLHSFGMTLLKGCIRAALPLSRLTTPARHCFIFGQDGQRSIDGPGFNRIASYLWRRDQGRRHIFILAGRGIPKSAPMVQDGIPVLDLNIVDHNGIPSLEGGSTHG